MNNAGCNDPEDFVKKVPLPEFPKQYLPHERLKNCPICGFGNKTKHLVVAHISQKHRDVRRRFGFDVEVNY